MCTGTAARPSRAQRLHNLGRVAMARGRKGAHGVAAVGVVRGRARRGAALGRAGLDLDDDAALAVDQVGAEERPDRQVGGGGVAAHAADVVGARRWPRG